MTKHGVPVRLEVANIGIGCSTQDNPANAAGRKGRRFNGSMDEVRLRPGVSHLLLLSEENLNSDWIKADFDTVNNESFVTIAPADALEVEWEVASGMVGVTNVSVNAAVVGGIVSGFGPNTTDCTIQGKFWKDGESEPSEWTNLAEHLALYDGFGVSVPCQESASYSYKLRAVDDDGGETEPITGIFTTPLGLAVTWSERYAVGVTNVFNHVAVIGGTLDDMGSSSSVTVQGKFWHGETEPAEWTTVGGPITQTGDFSVSVSGLAVHMDYSFKLRVAGSSGVVTETISGSFTTKDELIVAWASNSGLPGIEQISYGYIVAGGIVVDLGDSERCSILLKLWIDGETEPDAWTTISEGLVNDDTYQVSIPVAGACTYSYRFKAAGDAGKETAAVSGVFTAPGDEGESMGSPYTEIFDDGNNTFWIAKGFERYLQFTVTGYTGTETLTNFPVLVEVRADDANGFKYEDFYHYDGKDIAFVDEKGHIIPHEIDTWNKSGMSLFWVRLPEMVNGTKFTMCYRSPLLETPPDPGNTFEKYVGVWHMNERQNGVASLKDSSANNFETESHAKSTANSNGRIGYARRVAQEPGTSSFCARASATSSPSPAGTS